MKPKLSSRIWSVLLLEWFVGCMAVLGSMLCLCTTFDLPIPPTFWVLVPLLMLALCVLSQLQKADLICSVIGSALLLLLILLRRPLMRSALALWNILGSIYAEGYENLRDYFPAGLELDYTALSPILLAISALETFFTAVSVSRWRRAWPVIPAILPGVVPCFVLRDTLPPMLPLLMTVGAVMVLILSQNVRRRAPGETFSAFVWGGIVAVLLFGALLYFFPKRDYEPPVTWTQLTEKLNDWNETRSNRGNAAAGLTGNPDSVELGDLRSLPNRPSVVMEVQTDCPGRIYLRGSSYNRFDGRSWSRDSGPDRNPWTVFPSLYAPLGGGYTITVTPASGEKVYYIPDGPLTLPEGASLQGDAAFPNPEPEAPYSLRFTGADNITGVAGEDYSRYVRKICLELPDETRTGLRDWYREKAGDDAFSLSTNAKAALVARLVANAVPYSRDISRPPADQDFCLWFLTEAETGYCVHYATTAAAMLRALDIPAQYVSGFICVPNADGHAVVTTLQAHAWVEYYSDGCWHRLEPTPGQATEFTGRVNFDPNDTEEPTSAETTEETMPIASGSQETTEPVVTESAEIRPTETEPLQTTAPVTEPEPETEPEPIQAQPILPSLRWLLVPGGLLVLAFLIWERRRLARRLRERRFRRATGNDLALLYYQRYKKLCRLLKTEPGEAYASLAKKAAFSQHTLDAEELRTLRMEMFRAAAELNGAPMPKRLFYRWILAVI